MNKKLWNHIKSLRLTRRYFHVSANVGMTPDPRGHGFPSTPYIEKPGLTLVLRRKARLRTETNIPRTQA